MSFLEGKKTKVTTDEEEGERGMEGGWGVKGQAFY